MYNSSHEELHSKTDWQDTAKASLDFPIMHMQAASHQSSK